MSRSRVKIECHVPESQNGLKLAWIPNQPLAQQLQDNRRSLETFQPGPRASLSSKSIPQSLVT